MRHMTDRLKKSEEWGLLALLVFHIFVFPMGVSIAVKDGWDMFGLSDGQLNFAYYAISLALVFVFAGGYLRRSFDSLLDRPGDALAGFLLAWGIYILLNMVLGRLLSLFPFFSNENPNQTAIEGSARTARSIMIAVTVFMAPIVEETIFRGGIFCGLYHKSRALAYAVCIIAFSVYHIWQYAAFVDVKYLLFALQYIPASFALCWCYERSGSLWTCIFFHMSVNAVGVLQLMTTL
ncbi:MAG: type II CAAX endopeptidase family protein [Bacillota bacterium]|nr:type II CAAX endopeptidase family protein [Bacillota bacterium]